MVLIFFRLVFQSLALPCRLSSSMSSIHFPSLVLCLCHNPHFHFLHRSSINLFRPLPLPSASSSGLSISPRSTCSCFTSPLLFPFLVFFRPLNLARPRPSFSSGLYFSAPDVPPVANIVFLPPPLDMAKEAICALLAILGHFFEAFSPLDLFFAPAPFRPVPRPFHAFLHPGCLHLPASAHPVSSSIPTSSISRPSAQVNIIPAWFPSLSETSARAVFIFRASVALDFCRSPGPPAVTSSPVFATARCHCPRHHAKRISPSHHVCACAVDHVSPSRPAPRLFLFVSRHHLPPSPASVA